ncbi:hypothetical protein AAG570_011650 [Ranatra chinensis]|uniref:Prostaglandin reductase 1 n=1 Tax=Ranatra chinensis TaxID=642074 RepID=A0ABD0YXH2_9HEMI
MKGKRFVFAKHFDGVPKKSDFELVEEEVPPVKDGEVLFQALFISVDPYMRPYSARIQTGTTMIGEQVARVVESKHPGYKVGDNVVAYFGWRTHTVLNPDKNINPLDNKPSKPYILPDFGGVSLSTALGVLGMPGNTAYFGLTKLCEPKPGEVLVVNGAAGAVGSLVGQIGKILGLRVIGFAGSDDKVKLLKEKYNFDAAFNYKTKDVTEALKEAAPEGVDCFFDNVGGVMSSAIISCMKLYGRIAVCGSISAYNDDPKKPTLAPIIQPSMIFKQLKMEGFVVSRWLNIWQEGIAQNLQYIKEGKLKYEETVYEGFEKIFDAFIGLFKGENTGKAVVKI